MKYLKKFESETYSTMSKFKSTCEEILIPEIENIKFILEDEGSEILLTMGGEPGLPPGLYISIKPGYGKLSNKLKRKNYNIIYQEFMDRVEEICEENNCYIKIIESHNYDKIGIKGYSIEFRFGYIFKILPNGINLPKGMISYRRLGF